MIGKANRLGTSFKGLAAYLEHGRPHEGIERERVDWIESRNLPTRDPETAARLMAATARDSERVRKPVYHLSISFDPGDPVDRETMRRVADRTLRDLGLQDHQALIVAHKDRAHPHLHIVVNRVHPERCTAWSNSWDYRRIEASLREQEADLGLRVVPGKHAPVPERARGLERAPVERVRGDVPFLESVRAKAGPHLTGARSWSELERGLSGHGLSLRMKGRGMVVTDGAREVKASEIDPAASRFRLERRLGQYTDYRARQAVAGHTLDREGQERSATAPEIPRETPCEAAPPAPDRAYGAQPALPSNVEPVRAPEPEPVPVAQPVQPPTREPHVPADLRRLMDERLAGMLEREAQRLREAGRRAKLHEAAERLSQLAQVKESLEAVAEETGASYRAHDKVRRLEELLRRAEEGAHRLRVMLARMYSDDLGEVARKLAVYKREHGQAATERALRERPHAFGRVKRDYPAWGLGLVGSTHGARANASEVAGALEYALRVQADRPPPGALDAAREHARKADVTAEAAREVRRNMPAAATLEQHAADALRDLLRDGTPEWWVRQELARLLPDQHEPVRRALDRALSPEHGQSPRRGPDIS